MALFRLSFRWLRTSLKHSNKASGFTLLELLVAMIVAGIVVSGLLYIVVELLQIDRRESALTRTQLDMQRAINYIADDIREAVYVYEDPSVVASQLSDVSIATEVPVLAFWRPDVIDATALNCATFTAGSILERECQALEVRQSTYSLVLYLQKKKDGNANWQGQSRIIRYELDKYTNLSTLAKTTGYNDPAGVDTNFNGWTRDGTTTNGTKSVLVDFVATPDRDTSNPFNKSPLNDTVNGLASGAPRPCQSLGAEYVISPNTATTIRNTSFFSCIRDPSPTVVGSEGNGNQDVYLFLQGSIAGIGGSVGTIGNDSTLPILETRVLMRGVINKNPTN